MQPVCKWMSRSLYHQWHQAYSGYWKWSNTHYKLAKITCLECQCPWPFRMSSLSRIVCAKTRCLEIKDQEGPKLFLPFAQLHPSWDSREDEWMDGQSQRLSTEWTLGFESTEQKTEKPPERKIQCGSYLSLGHLTQNRSDFNLIHVPRTQEHALPVHAPAQGQRSMFFCHSANWMHLFDLAFSKSSSSQISTCTEHDYLIYFDYALFGMHILIV